jgi:hypothetical protein
MRLTTTLLIYMFSAETLLLHVVETDVNSILKEV